MKRSSLALAIAMAPTLALAETPSREDALKLSDTLITANRDLEARDHSTTASTVFTREDIERLRPSNVLDLLTRVPGVQVATYGGRGAGYSLFIRGTSSAQSLILIDGVRVGSATAGGASLQYLTVEQIERVEVLRGSRSAIYGADALGGVVQIFTRRASGEGLKPYVRLAGGSDGAWERNLGLSGDNGQTRFNLSASLEEVAGYDRTETSYDSDADHDGYRNRSLAFNVRHRFGERLEAGLSTLDQRGKAEFDNPFGRWDGATFTSNPAEPYDRFVISTTAAYLDAQVTERWNSRIEFGHSEDKQENFDKLFPGSTVNNNYRDSVSWLNKLALDDANTLRLGADYLNDKVRSSNDFAEPSRWNQAVFVQHGFAGEHFSTELGLRHDKNEQYGSENTFNAALTLPVDARNQLVFSYTEGFRVPTFADLYWPVDWSSGYVGNPGLSPEQSKGYEIQWRSQIAASTRLEIAAYRTDFRNLLGGGTDPVTGLSTQVNVTRARIQGLEANLEQDLLGWQTQLGLSVIDPRSREDGHTLPYRARRTLSLDVDRRFGDFGVGASWRAVSRSYSDTANEKEVAGHGVVDLRGSWQATNELGFDLTLANLFDQEYSRLSYSYGGEDYGYREQPLSVMLGMTWSPSL